MCCPPCMGVFINCFSGAIRCVLHVCIVGLRWRARFPCYVVPPGSPAFGYKETGWFSCYSVHCYTFLALHVVSCAVPACSAVVLTSVLILCFIISVPHLNGAASLAPFFLLSHFQRQCIFVPTLVLGVLASLQSTGAQSIQSQEQVQHENEKEHARQGVRACFVTIDRGAKNRTSRASATPERREHAIQGPTTSLLHPTRATMRRTNTLRQPS